MICDGHGTCYPYLPSEKDFLPLWMGVSLAETLQLQASLEAASAAESRFQDLPDSAHSSDWQRELYTLIYIYAWPSCSSEKHDGLISRASCGVNWGINKMFKNLKTQMPIKTFSSRRLLLCLTFLFDGLCEGKWWSDQCESI